VNVAIGPGRLAFRQQILDSRLEQSRIVIPVTVDFHEACAIFRLFAVAPKRGLHCGRRLIDVRTDMTSLRTSPVGVSMHRTWPPFERARHLEPTSIFIASSDVWVVIEEQGVARPELLEDLRARNEERCRRYRSWRRRSARPTGCC